MSKLTEQIVEAFDPIGGLPSAAEREDGLEAEYGDLERIAIRVAAALEAWTYTTGTGQLLENVHEESDDCRENGCVIHNPSDDGEAIGPTHWRSDRGIMERICCHGIGHPDPDGERWAERTFGPEPYRGVHGCDGCCAGSGPECPGG